MTTTFISNLKEKLTQPLPGRAAQNKMSHATRKFYKDPPNNVRKAAVLALFYLKNQEWNIVLIQRPSNNPHDRHKGQISFPGGAVEAGETYEVAARREAEEEVGVNAHDIQILGQLTDLYIPVSNFMVYPFVGFLDYEPQFIPQESEVAEVLEVPISLLQNEANRKLIDMKPTPNMVLKNVPYFDVNGKVVWGATGMMLSELLEVLH